MASRTGLFLLSVSLAGSAWAAPAGDSGTGRGVVIEPKVERRSVAAAAIDTENFELGLYAGLLNIEDFGSHPVYGARLVYHVTEDVFVEGTYGRSKAGQTSFERLSGAARLLTDEMRQYSYYAVSLGYNVLPGEAFWGRGRALNSALYIAAGVGVTDFAGDERFTVNLGFGYQLLLNDWFAGHLFARDHMLEMDVIGASETVHNLELGGGFTVFF
ncbi:MAG TPA: outer membrane beta-barrel domain-containing protein [Gammaproteobacteria bacterium]|nr:outer membrane beta-barrel domain-containing protein [Gammaproteobacteria bacterium]